MDKRMKYVMVIRLVLLIIKTVRTRRTKLLTVCNKSRVTMKKITC